jgi:O-antigen ligase
LAKRAAVSLEALRLREIWTSLRREPWSFWFLCAYLFFEYVRPQSLYPVIDVLPYATLALALTVAAMFAEGGSFRLRTPADKLLLAFTGVVLLSSIFALEPSESFSKIYIFLSWVFVYFLIINIVVTEKRLFIFVLSFLLYSFKMSQHGTREWVSIGFQFRDWGTYGAPGWFQNSGEFGIQMTIFFPIAIYLWMGLRHKWSQTKSLMILALPVTALLGMIASSSRGALLGGATVGAWMVYRSKYRVRGLVFAAAAAMVLFAIVPTEQKSRIGDSGSDDTSIERIEMWKDGLDIAKAYPVLGIGYFNWISYRVRGGHRALLSHNIFIQCMTELGYTGLMVFLALIFMSFYMNGQSRRMLRRVSQDRNNFLWSLSLGLDGALVGFLTSGFFVTVLYYPFFWVNLALTASLHVVVRGQYRQRLAARNRRPLHRPRPSVAGHGPPIGAVRAPR